MKVDVLTLFPEMFTGPLDVSIVQRARQAGVLDLHIRNLRDYTHDRHQTVDDRPFGGGPGMVLKPEPLFEAVENLAGEQTHVVLTTPAGRAMAGLLAIFAEFEREILRERTRAGLTHARENGKRLGRPATAAVHAAEIRKLHRAGVSKSETARRVQIGRTSVRRILGAKP